MRDVLPYLVPHVVLSGLAYGLVAGEFGVYRVATGFCVAVVFLDLLYRPHKESLPKSLSAKNNVSAALWPLLSWLLFPLFLLLLFSGFWVIEQGALAFRELILVTVAIGFTGAIFAIPMAHELMHNNNRFAKIAATLVMIVFGYGHFCIEHLHGHHRNVATPHDPATARLGESFYEFYSRVVAGSLIGAWRIEEKRLRRRGLRVIGFANRALRNWVIQVFLYAFIAVLLGWQGLVFIVLIGIIGFSTLEVINSWAIGFTGAIFAIPMAHELMHNNNRFAKIAATLVMIVFGYGHFCIEHLHGHHRNVATPHDPATARLGESFYEFYSRVVAGSLIGAWRIEEKRLRRRGLRVIGFANRALRNWVIQVFLYAFIAVLLGWQGLVFIVLIGERR